MHFYVPLHYNNVLWTFNFSSLDEVGTSFAQKLRRKKNVLIMCKIIFLNTQNISWIGLGIEFDTV